MESLMMGFAGGGLTLLGAVVVSLVISFLSKKGWL